MVTLLDPDEPEVHAAAVAAREIFIRLEAKPFLARLDQAMERRSAAAMPEAEPSRKTEDGTFRLRRETYIVSGNK